MTALIVTKTLSRVCCLLDGVERRCVNSKPHTPFYTHHRHGRLTLVPQSQTNCCTRPDTRPTTESSGQQMRLSPGESTLVNSPRRSTIPTEAVSTHSMQQQEKGMMVGWVAWRWLQEGRGCCGLLVGVGVGR